MNTKRRLFLKAGTLASGAAMLTRPLTTFASYTNKISGLNRFANSVNVLHTHAVGKMTVSDLTTALSQNDRGILLEAAAFAEGKLFLKSENDIIRTMNNAGYHAVTMGAKEISNIEKFAALVPSMKFAVVNCNYTFSDDAVQQLVKRYHIVTYGRFKIGITGVGEKVKTAAVSSSDPCVAAEDTAALLKNNLGCDVVICLSRISLKDNTTLAEQSAHIDIIITNEEKAHLHGPSILKNRNDEDVIVSFGAEKNAVVRKISFGFSNADKTAFESEQHLQAC